MSTNPLFKTIQELTVLMERTQGREEESLKPASTLIADLVATDDWLPEAQAQPHPQYYQQHPLYIDPLDRFSLVSFVWGPGQSTPIHDHTVWGVVGMLRGSETEQRYQYEDNVLVPTGPTQRLMPGQISCVSPATQDIHKVSNAHSDQVSISIHVYGGNIGKIERSVYDDDTGLKKTFVSGYTDTPLPVL